MKNLKRKVLHYILSMMMIISSLTIVVTPAKAAGQKPILVNHYSEIKDSNVVLDNLKAENMSFEYDETNTHFSLVKQGLDTFLFVTNLFESTDKFTTSYEGQYIGEFTVNMKDAGRDAYGNMVDARVTVKPTIDALLVDSDYLNNQGNFKEDFLGNLQKEFTGLVIGQIRSGDNNFLLVNSPYIAGENAFGKIATYIDFEVEIQILDKNGNIVKTVEDYEGKEYPAKFYWGVGDIDQPAVQYNKHRKSDAKVIRTWGTWPNNKNISYSYNYLPHRDNRDGSEYVESVYLTENTGKVYLMKDYFTASGAFAGTENFPSNPNKWLLTNDVVYEDQKGNTYDPYTMYIGSKDSNEGYEASVVFEAGNAESGLDFTYHYRAGTSCGVAIGGLILTTYKAEYNFKSATGESLPEEVIRLLPVDDRDHMNKEIITAILPNETTVTTSNGDIWKFVGYEDDYLTVEEGDVTFIGKWVKVEDSYVATYEFASTTPNKQLPDKVKNLVPIDTNSYKDGTTIQAIMPEKTEVSVYGGTWKFIKYDNDALTVNGTDIHFIGYWTFIPEGMKANDDKLVIDYGLTVALNKADGKWSIYDNDEIPENCRIGQVEINSDSLTQGELMLDDEGVIYYRPNRIMNAKDSFTYTIKSIVTPDGDTLESNISATVTIYPASIMYYEADYVAKKKDDITIDTDTLQSEAQQTEYGYDEVYLDKEDVIYTEAEYELYDADNGDSESFKFTFTGTGVDIVGHSNVDSGKLSYIVKDHNDKVATFGVVDTYYSADSVNLTQTPVVEIRLPEAGEYTVYVKVKESVKGTSDGNSANSFTLDGIRVYDTLKQNGEDKNVYYEVSDTDGKQADATISCVKDFIRKNQAAIVTADEDGIQPWGNTILEDLENMGYYNDYELQNYVNNGPYSEAYLDTTNAFAFVAKVNDISNYICSLEMKSSNIESNYDIDDIEFNVIRESNSDALYEAPAIYMVTLDDNDQVVYTHVADATGTAMYTAIDVTKGIDLGNGKYLVILAAISTEDQTLSLTNLKTSNIELTSPYFDSDAIEKFTVDEEDPIPTFNPQILQVSYSGNTKSVAKKTKNSFYVAVPKEQAEDIDHFDVYYTDVLMSNLETDPNYRQSVTVDGVECIKFKVTFKAPTSKGTFAITYYAVDSDDNVSLNSYDFSLIVK